MTTEILFLLAITFIAAGCVEPTKKSTAVTPTATTASAATASATGSATATASAPIASSAPSVDPTSAPEAK